MRHSQIAVAAQNHCTEIAAAAEDAGKVGGGKGVFVQEVLQDVPAFDLEFMSNRRGLAEPSLRAMTFRGAMVPERRVGEDLAPDTFNA